MFPIRYRKAFRIFCLVTLAFAFGAGHASARDSDTGKHPIWRVTNAPAPFYLVGSVHALSGKEYPLPKVIMDAFHESKQVLFEFDPNADEEFAKKFAKIGKYPTGETVMNRLHPETLKFLETRFRRMNWHFDEVKDWKAWRIANLWGIRGYSNVAGQYGLDNYLAYQCRRLGKATGGLETVDEHVAVMAEMTDLDGEIILLDEITQGDKRRETYNGLVAAWKRGDTAAIWETEKRRRSQAPWISSRLLDMRNLRWIPRIESVINSGKPTMVVAGCAHFAGPPSVLKLLAARGYKIEQL